MGLSTSPSVSCFAESSVNIDLLVTAYPEKLRIQTRFLQYQMRI